MNIPKVCVLDKCIKDGQSMLGTMSNRINAGYYITSVLFQSCIFKILYENFYIFKFINNYLKKSPNRYGVGIDYHSLNTLIVTVNGDTSPGFADTAPFVSRDFILILYRSLL